VASSTIRKAALLLMGLDPMTAAELLKAARPDLVAEIAAELAYLGATGQHAGAPGAEPMEEFCGMLRGTGPGASHETFIQRMLEAAVGEKQSKELLSEVRRRVDVRDPFIPIRSAEAALLGQALEGEPPQVVALVLSELPPDKSGAVIPLLPEAIRVDAVRRMTGGALASPEARMRIATIIRKRLDGLREAAGGEAAGPEGRLRRVAVLLRTVKTELRDSLIKAIGEQDANTATAVRDLMVLWEDIPQISDRSLQEVLRSVEARQLALALSGADPAIDQKIRANVSERARAAIAEESSLMKAPKAEEVEQARAAILGGLRELNTKGDLRFEEA
jgi:flagellar motor switch protein FliG